MPPIHTRSRRDAPRVVSERESPPTLMFAGGGTGGHLYPGLAIARSVRRLAPQVRAVFVGARRGIERDVLPTQPFAFELLDLHPLYRPQVWRNWRTVRGGIESWIQLVRLVRRERPQLVVGTGGYASGLALAYAAAHRIRIVQQIADSHPGLTARYCARWCKEIYLGYPEAAGFLAPGRGTQVIDTGNPIDPPPAVRLSRSAALRAWGWPEDTATVILVFGGSQGARPVNEAVDGLVARGLPGGVRMIWATGRAHYDRYAPRESASLRVRPYLSPIAEAYAASDIAVTRAGAMTTAELCAWSIPMVLVPLPTAAADHQTANAVALARAGAAVHLPQRELTAETLGRLIEGLVGDPARRARLAAAAALRARPTAAEDIARRILSLMQLR